jgi:polyisoprenoid-binding protein YceI
MENRNLNSAIVLVLMISMTAFKTDVHRKSETITVNPVMFPDASLWDIDVEHSNVCFTVYHLDIAEVMGFFKKFKGSMESGSKDFSDASINLTIDVNSIDSNSESRDTHLKSNDFFNAVQFPEMKFKSKSFKKQKGKNYKLTGELTIRDVTKNVTFDVEHLGNANILGIQKVAFKAITRINRFSFNVNWNETTPDDTPLIGNMVTIQLNLELNKRI